MNKEEMKKQERVIVLIDGSNFYYSTAKEGRKIDFQKLIKELTGDRELVRAYYYVAPLDIEANEEKYWSHQKFINKLKQIPKFEVVLCTLKKIKVGGKFIYVVKGDDVKMSNTLLMGAVDNLYDIAIVVSGDEDFLDSINIVKKRYGKRIENAYFSKSSSSNLREVCDFTINLNKIINKFEIKKRAQYCPRTILSINNKTMKKRYLNFVVKKGKKGNNGGRNLLLIGISLILVIGLVFIVSALTPEEELNQLEQELIDAGYGWLVDYNLSYPEVGVYRENSDELVARFESIIGSENGAFEKYRILLTNLSEGEKQQVFDLRSVCGDVERINREILLTKMRLDEIRKELNKNGGEIYNEGRKTI